MSDGPNGRTREQGNVVATFQPANDAGGIPASTEHAAAVLSNVAISASHLASVSCTDADRAEFFRLGQSAFGLDTTDLHRVSLADAIESLIATHPDARRTADAEADALSVRLAVLDVLNARLDRIDTQPRRQTAAEQLSRLMLAHVAARAKTPPGLVVGLCAMDDRQTQGAYDA